jgi:hypothetical protein
VLLTASLGGRAGGGTLDRQRRRGGGGAVGREGNEGGSGQGRGGEITRDGGGGEV